MPTTLLPLGRRKIAYNYECINKTPISSLVGLVLTLFLTIILLYKILIS